MTVLEIILTFVSTIATSGNIFQWLSSRKKNEFDGLKEHISFLEERIVKLEEFACYHKDCKERI